MDSLTFFAQVITALAWPITLVIVLLLLRRPLLDLIPLLQRLKYKDLELDFGSKVQELAAEAQEEFSWALEGQTNLDRISVYYAPIAAVSPRAAVLEAWLELESAAIAASKRHGLELTSAERRSPIELGRALEQAGILDENKKRIFHRLRNLRNAAAHASEFALDADSAIEYADLATRLTEYLRKT